MNPISRALTMGLLFIAGCHAGGINSAATNAAAKADASSDDRAIATLYVKGLSCPLCANNIDKQLARVPGVRNVAVDLGAGKVTLSVSADQPPSREQLAKAVDASGFTLDRIEMPPDAKSNPDGLAQDADR